MPSCSHPSDDFNALAAAEPRIELGHGSVHRVAPAPETDLLPPSTDTGLLGNPGLTFDELTRRFASGERLIATVADGAAGMPWQAGTPGSWSPGRVPCASPPTARSRRSAPGTR